MVSPKTASQGQKREKSEYKITFAQALRFTPAVDCFTKTPIDLDAYPHLKQIVDKWVAKWKNKAYDIPKLDHYFYDRVNGDLQERLADTPFSARTEFKFVKETFFTDTTAKTQFVMEVSLFVNPYV